MSENSISRYGDVVVNVSKYELWNALFMAHEDTKTDIIVDLENKLNDLMAEPGRVVIHIRVEG